jgi:hypothetical protein
MAEDNGRPDKFQKILNRITVNSGQRRRLKSGLAEFKTRFDMRRKSNAGAAWVVATEDCVKRAEEALEDRDLDPGWECLMAAERHLIESYDETELQSRRTEIIKEVSSKLSDWRRETVLVILDPADEKVGVDNPKLRMEGSEANGARDLSALRSQLRSAVRLRDEHFSNVYRKIELRRKMLLITAPMLAAALWVIHAMARNNPAGYLGEPQAILTVIVFGVFGGLISTALSLANNKDAGKRIPEHIANTYVTFVRPLFGAGFAVATYIVLKSGVVTLFDGKPGAYALAAFLAGFSERWFLGIVTAGIDASPKKEQ